MRDSCVHGDRTTTALAIVFILAVKWCARDSEYLGCANIFRMQINNKQGQSQIRADQTKPKCVLTDAVVGLTATAQAACTEFAE